MELSWALESGIQLKESWIPLKLEYRIRVPLSKAGIQYLELVSTVDKWAFIDLFLTLILCRWKKKLHIRVRQEKHRAGNGTKDHKTNKRRYLEIMIKKKKTEIIKFYPRSLYWSCNSHFSVSPQNHPISSRRSGSPQLVVQSLLCEVFGITIHSQWLSMHYAWTGKEEVSTSKAGFAHVAFCYIFANAYNMPRLSIKDQFANRLFHYILILYTGLSM